MRFLLALILVIVASAQTGVRPGQIASTGGVLRLLAVSAAGSVVEVVIPGATLDTSVTPARLVLPASAPAAIREHTDVTKAGIPQTSFSLSEQPVNDPVVVVNGLEQTVVEDYTYIAGSRTITLLRPAENGDIVRIRYRW